MGGRRLLLLPATTFTEKSSCRKAIARQAKLIPTKNSSPMASPGARAMAWELRRHAPQEGTTASSSAKHRAIIRAK